MAETITIVGASARAAAQSAARAGFMPVAADLFADRDLAAMATVIRVADYPRDFERVCGAQQPGDWFYTGALENFPDVVERLEVLRPLLGNRAAVLREVRRPDRVADALRAAGLSCPRYSFIAPQQGTISWLRKPLLSSGGMHISPWPAVASQLSREDEVASDAAPGSWYFQEQISGDSRSAVFLAAGRQAYLVAMSRQLIGTAWLRSVGFRYAGSIGPLPRAGAIGEQFAAIGQVLARAFDLVGLFGVDAVVRDDTVWPVEVNPRYTASVEIAERAGGFSAVAGHVAACHSGDLAIAVESLGCSAEPAPETEAASHACCGKGILFASKGVTISPRLSDDWLAFEDGLGADYADVPPAGTHIPAGGPIVTLLAAAATIEEVEGKLRKLARENQQRLAGLGE